MIIDFAALAGFAAAFLIAAAIPGPFVAALITRALAHGFRTGFGLALGAMAGDLFWASCALFGLALIASALAPALLMVRIGGGAYLIWMGWRILTAPAETLAGRAGAANESLWRCFLSGLSITLGNPKTMAFYFAAMPGFFDFAAIGWRDKLAILAVIPPVLMAVMCAYALAAARARRVLRDPGALRAINRAAGAVIMLAGALIARG